MKRSKWLSRKDSNLRLKLQRLQCYHYTTRQYQSPVCPSCQASDRFASVYVFSPRRHGAFPVVRKEITMKTLTVIGSTTNPISQKGDEMSKAGPSRGTDGKGDHRRESTDLKQPVPLLSALIVQHTFLVLSRGFRKKFLGFLKVFSERSF